MPVWRSVRHRRRVIEAFIQGDWIRALLTSGGTDSDRPFEGKDFLQDV